LPVLLRSIEVVPFVVDTREAEMRFGREPPRRITDQCQHVPVGPCRQSKLVVRFLDLSQTECRRDGVDGIRERFTPNNDFGICLAGRGPVSLELMGMAQRIDGGSADWHVVSVQILQGAPRLGNDGIYIVLNDSQCRSYRGDAPYQVSLSVVWFAALQGCFSSLEFFFDGGMSAAKE